MSRRALLVFAFLAICSWPVSSAGAAEPAFGRKPNIVLVMTDDQGDEESGRERTAYRAQRGRLRARRAEALSRFLPLEVI